MGNIQITYTTSKFATGFLELLKNIDSSHIFSHDESISKKIFGMLLQFDEYNKKNNPNFEEDFRQILSVFFEIKIDQRFQNGSFKKE